MKNRLVAAAVCFLCLAGVASADTLDVVGDSTWHPFQTPSNSGTPFWNNSSIDGPQCNVGYWLNGSGACPGFNAPSPNITPPYLGDSNTTFSFTRTPDTASVTVTSRLDVTAIAATNEVGWFDTANPAVLNPLFQGVTAVGVSVPFVPSASYGFYLRSQYGTYLSTGTGDSRTHFAVFQLASNGRYLFAIEDMWAGSDWDYNDLVLEIAQNAVPEPATVALVGCGLVCLGAAARRRRARRP